MKAAFIIFVICATIINVIGLPTAANEEAHPSNPVRPVPLPAQWPNPWGYEFMMCRLQCRESCFDKGYWTGGCRNGQCYCHGFMGKDQPKMSEFPMPFY